LFVKGQIYHRRKDIHGIYGGQQQGGISTPTNHPMVMIFSGDNGSEFGYKDGWTTEGIFQYTGEGQIGDMQLIKGNRAILEHEANGKSIYFFEYVKTGYVKFVSEMICIGYHFRESIDRNGDTRKAIVFELLPVENIDDGIESNKQSDSNSNILNKSLKELRLLASNASGGTRTIEEKKKEVVIRSNAVKLYALKRANGFCEYCGMTAPFNKSDGEPYLEVHHIKKLSDGGPDHPEWVAAVCPNCHRNAHYGSDKLQVKQDLLKIIRDKEAKL